MERDTDRTFEEIHGTIENFLSAVEEIERVALVQTSEDAPIQPRFLTPRDDSDDCVDFTLTQPSQYEPGQDYIAVSYTWAHSQSTENMNIPDYRIWDGEAEFRTLRCPSVVFHRAFKYARAKECTYLWIDQECINQNDPADVEKHLQIMHRIYRDSRWTVAILSCTFTNEESQIIVDFLDKGFEPKSPHLRDQQAKLLKYISSDQWFTRTWTFHEQHCAGALEYLIAAPNAHSLGSNYEQYVVDNDICFCGLLLHEQLHSLPTNDPEFWWLLLECLKESEIYTSITTACGIYFRMESCNNSVTPDRLAIFANVFRYSSKLKTTVLNKPQYSYSTCLLVLYMVNQWPDKAEREAEYRQLSMTSSRIGGRCIWQQPIGNVFLHLSYRTTE